MIVGGKMLSRIARQQAATSIEPHAPCMWPRVDLIETRSKFCLRVELAGVVAENVQVDYLPDRHSLLIRGVREADMSSEGPADDGSTAHLLEIFSGEFAREVKLPDSPIEPQSIRSAIREGMMEVSVPKARVRHTHTRVTIRKV